MTQRSTDEEGPLPNMFGRPPLLVLPSPALTRMWGIITFLIGIAYGFFAKGRQDKSRLFMTGLLIGLVLAIIFGLLGGLRGLGLPGGFLGILLAAILLTILFVIGVWLGDMIEGRSGRSSSRRDQ